MKNSKIMIVTLLIASVLAVSAAGCTTTSKQPLRVATTTSLYDTGLWNYLEPMFEQNYSNVDLQITSQGTGKAIELANRGDCDALAVHSPTQEKTFIDSGKGMNQRCFATNYFIIVGPESDPAGIRGLNATAAFQKIYQLGTNNTPGVTFVSRGDQSGTHTQEQAIWKAAGYNYTTQIEGSGAWYVETGQGMGATLQVTDQKQGYTLSDEGTYLSFKSNLALTPLITTGSNLLNRYSVITVYNANFTSDSISRANNFVNWMISNQTQQIIGQYGVVQYGKPLFTPMYGNCSQYNCDCTTPATQLVPTPVSATSIAAANVTTTRTATSTVTANVTTTRTATS